MDKAQEGKPAPLKKPLPAFFIFKQHNYDQMKKENPNAKITELTSMITVKWRDAPEKEKNKYEVLQVEAREKYEKEVAAYEKEYGKLERTNKILNSCMSLKQDINTISNKRLCYFSYERVNF